MATQAQASTTTWDSPTSNAETIWLIAGMIVAVIRTGSIFILLSYPILVFAGWEEASCSSFFAKHLSLYFLVSFVTLLASATCILMLLNREETAIPTLKKRACNFHCNLYKFSIASQLTSLFFYEWACLNELAIPMGLILASFATIDYICYYVIKREAEAV